MVKSVKVQGMEEDPVKVCKPLLHIKASAVYLIIFFPLTTDIIPDIFATVPSWHFHWGNISKSKNRTEHNTPNIFSVDLSGMIRSGETHFRFSDQIQKADKEHVSLCLPEGERDLVCCGYTHIQEGVAAKCHTVTFSPTAFNWSAILDTNITPWTQYDI